MKIIITSDARIGKTIYERSADVVEVDDINAGTLISIGSAIKFEEPKVVVPETDPEVTPEPEVQGDPKESDQPKSGKKK